MTLLKCRVCLRVKPSRICESLFLKQDDLTTAELIMTCTSAQIVENDGLPDHICVSCYQRLVITIDFIREVYTSDQALRKVTQCEEMTVEYESDDGYCALELSLRKEGVGDFIVDYVQELDEDRKGDKRLYRLLSRGNRYKCKYCNYESNDVRDLAIHTKDNHSCELPVITEPEKSKKKIVRQLPPKYCLICDEKFPTAKSVIKHVDENHFEQFGNTRKISCSMCHLKFYSYTPLIFHMRKIHHKYTRRTNKTRQYVRKKPVQSSYLCSYCGDYFKTPQQLTRHVMVHEGNQPYKCDQCVKSFTIAIHLQQHKLVNHSNEKPFHCEQCPKTFAVWNQLKRHTRITHESAQTYPCDTCLYKAKTRHHLERHKMTHGPKRYVCSICPAGFTMKKYLMQHLKKHYAYVCSWCLEPFDSEEILNGHVVGCKYEKQRKVWLV